MTIRRSVHGLGFAAFLSLLAAHDAPRADATPQVLASASFESDAVGATARPGVPVEVVENLWNASTYSGGVSEVVASGSTKRYRLSDAAASGQVKGIRLPLSSTVSTGTLTVQGVLTAEQAGSGGGFLAVDEPNEDKWLGCVGFGGDGKFAVHDGSTAVAYASGTRYAVLMTVHFGTVTTVDYEISNADTEVVLLSETGRIVVDAGSAGSVSFRTDATDEGAFTVDEILATQ